MLRRNPGLILLLLVVASHATSCVWLERGPGAMTATYTAVGQGFRIRVDRHVERGPGFVAGAFFVFQSAPLDAEQWHPIMEVRHDDPVDIPTQQIRFVSSDVAYVFMCWEYAVTTDGG